MSFFDQGPLGPGTVSDITRRDPQTGRTQINVADPDRPTRRIWVDAVWNPVTYQWAPIDPRYAPGETYPARRWISSFADSGGGMDFSGPLDVGPLPTNGSNSGSTFQIPSLARRESSDNSGVLLVVAALLAIYLFSG